jgi:hypothetical protein
MKMHRNERAQPKRNPDAMRAEYDFSTGKRGAFLKRFPTGVTLIALDEDVRREFPTAAAVNKALRSLAKTKPAARRPKTSKI